MKKISTLFCFSLFAFHLFCVAQPEILKQAPLHSSRSNIDLKAAVLKDSIQYHALLIGVQEYDMFDKLKKPIEDIVAIQKILVAKYCFKEHNIIALKNPTLADIKKNIEKLIKKLKPTDNLLIFFAGHGVWEEYEKKGYWLPIDAKPDKSETWMPNEEIKSYIAQMKAKHILLISDACYSGGIFYSRDIPENNPEYIKKLYYYPSRKAMTSGNLEKVPDQSSFAEMLIQQLHKNEQLYLPSIKLFINLVEKASSVSLPQHGTLSKTGDRGGDFIFVKR